MPVDEELREMARYFYTIKDIRRLRILVALAEDGEMTVTQLAHTLHISQPLVSFHLRPLRLLDLVQVRRAGREVYCSVNLPEIQHRHVELVKMLTEAVSSGD
ncbi:MAG TPA: helix-turn-helix transcriptional regulator [Thermoflexia bacterium]|nr:helix-turn-helix transcriptional regulator [Thermoflexia bacterium]